MNELYAGITRLVLAGIGTILSGLVLYYIKRVSDRKDAEEQRHESAHKRYERNFVRIDEENPDYHLETEK